MSQHNINDMARVTLTAKGMATWAKWHSDLGVDPPAYSQALRIELWRIMQVFGPEIHMGMIGTHFVNNRIEIEGGC